MSPTTIDPILLSLHARSVEKYHMDAITDEDFGALLHWSRTECEIRAMMLHGQLGFSELFLRQQLNYDRLVGAPTAQQQH